MLGEHKVQTHTSGKISYLKLCVAMETFISSPGVPLPPFITGSCVNAFSWKKELTASRGAAGRSANSWYRGSGDGHVGPVSRRWAASWAAEEVRALPVKEIYHLKCV